MSKIAILITSVIANVIAPCQWGRKKPNEAADRYNEVRKTLPSVEVSYGCGGIKMFSALDLGDGQVGYSVAPDSGSLCSGETGAWHSNWVVIGYETACGNPLFIDIDDPSLPVFTALHGEGAWEPIQVAASIEAFGKCIDEFSRISAGRSNPIEREAIPIGNDERTVFLHRIAELNRTTSAPEFWDVLLEG